MTSGDDQQDSGFMYKNDNELLKKILAEQREKASPDYGENRNITNLNQIP
jgi:hypothetical protein